MSITYDPAAEARRGLWEQREAWRRRAEIAEAKLVEAYGPAETADDVPRLPLPKRTVQPCTGLPTLAELAARAAERSGRSRALYEAGWALARLNNVLGMLGQDGVGPDQVAERLAAARLALIQIEAVFPEADHEAALGDAIRRLEDRLASGGPQAVDAR